MKNTEMTFYLKRKLFWTFLFFSKRVKARIRARSSHCSGPPRFIHLAIDNLRMHLKKHGPSLQKGMDTNPTKGFYIIRNALGPSARLLLNEVEQKTEDACLFKSIEVSGHQVSYTKMVFSGSKERQNPTNLVNPPDDGTLNVHVLNEQQQDEDNNQQLVHLPLLSSLIWCITEGLAHLPLPLTHIKGAILCGIESLKEDEHLEAILHSDFPADRSFFPSGSPQPMTVFFHLGPDPLELLMGSLTTRVKEHHTRAEESIILQPGDMALWSWRQWHRSGRPISFPTIPNYRFHLMLAARDEDVQDDTVDIHTCPENRDRLDSIAASHPNNNKSKKSKANKTNKQNTKKRKTTNKTNSK